MLSVSDAAKDNLLKQLATLGKLLGYNEHKPVVEVAEYAVACQEAFDLEQKDTSKLLWYMFGRYKDVI